MASRPSVVEAQKDIALINSVLEHRGPDHSSRGDWTNQLEQSQRRLANLQRAEAAQQPMHTNGYMSSRAESKAPVSLKRSLGLTTGGGPQPKRVSANPSPQSPDYSNFNPHLKHEWSLPTRHGESPGSSGVSDSDYIDLTISDPPSPVSTPGPINASHNGGGHPDPFADLANAFRDDRGRPTPATAFNQEFMRPDELARFLTTPTPAGGDFAFQQQLLQQAAASGELRVPSDFPNRSMPYFPDSRPDWLGRESDDNEDYGDLTLNATEAESIERMLEIVAQNGKDTQEDREQTPRIMSSTLKEYQKIGLTWLMKMEGSRNKGGILADEMGLGKTVQALALICARPSQNPLCKTTLIIAPVALMRQWEKEIAHHVKDRHRLSVYLYWGNGKKADFNLLRQYDVVLTTFGTLTSEFKQKDSRRETTLHERELNEPGFRRKPREKLGILGHECMWYRIIIDEAHMIKNRNSIQSKATVDLQARFRLCLTGTPMMNSIDELFPLLRFLQTGRYVDWKLFSFEIAKPAKHQNQATRDRAMNRVQILLKGVMLRRQKKSEVDGKPILNLPAKHTLNDNVEFDDDEMAIYKALEAKSQIQLNKYLKQNSMSANYACILVLLLRLRQACCHPHLITDLSQPATEGIAEDDLLERARHLSDDVVRRLTEAEAFECPICLEADPNPTIIIPCGHTCCGTCVQKVLDPSNRGQDGNDERSTAKCPQCRGELRAKLITDYKHFCKVYCPERLASEDRVVEEESDSDADSDDDEYDDGVDDKGNLAGFVVSDGEESEQDFTSEDIESDFASRGNSARPTSQGVAKKTKSKGKARARPKKSLAQLKKESQRSKEAKKQYLRRLKKTWIPSAKIIKTVELLTNIRENDPTDKTLIFSQFTSLLDLVEVPLMHEKFKYQRYDGSMTMEARADAVEAFMEGPDNIMLVSLKAGNAGLNLWRASQVILLDPFWNPFVEEQAVDRAHRMPQEREVFVHRVLVPETVEDRICALQEKKREIIGAALDENASKGLARLNIQELKYLFGLS
ncbi:SNF2 family N-terminal domain-containing protein [Ampelomyces quisqualis]|uniref:SNF2 family N-terminal domain-containing protein n=1 Tax=Ampelomyces quisqualis TaxID=50730 RepID=A0A6A5QG10_AMPQU|nr:SNF2 family N-terminal domain-containing protein [Ampelomyces quisqualis]